MTGRRGWLPPSPPSSPPCPQAPAPRTSTLFSSPRSNGPALAIHLSAAGTSRRERRKSQQSGTSEWAPWRGLGTPTAGPLLSAGVRSWPPGVGVNLTNGSLSRCRGAGTSREPRDRHTPSGLRAVRLVPKANTELMFPAYSFHVWAASGCAGSLGSLLLALPKPPSLPSLLLESSSF